MGSIQLTPQEIRNNTLRGSFNDLLKLLASNVTFKEMLHLRLKNDEDNMAHEELILRFFAYHDSEYKRVNNLSFFLTEYMKKNQNINQERIDQLNSLFLNTLNLVKKYLGDKAFSNFGEKTGKWASRSNRSLYDAEMLAFADFIDKKITITSDQFISELITLMKQPEFKKSLHSQAGGKMIEKRVQEIKNLINITEQQRKLEPILS